MKIQTIDPKELPYYDRLNAVRQVIDHIDKDTGRYDIRGPCVEASRLAPIFIPELEQVAGIYVPLCYGHAFNYDSERKIYVDLTMDQFNFQLKSRWNNEKRLAELRIKKKKELSAADLKYYEREERAAQPKLTAAYLLGNFQLHGSDRPENLLRYQALHDIPYYDIPKIVALPEKNTLLKRYTIPTHNVISKQLKLEELIEKVEAKLAQEAA
jgi:hypothetical protein